jgi:L-2-amino-thiazoline-4-carboxylic acid hydrolase
LYVAIPVIEQAKIQAQVLVPLVKALQAELGEERANGLVRKALGDLYRRHGEQYWRTRRENNLGTIMASAFATYARKDALDYRVIEQSPVAFEIDVTGCRYAEFYKELGEPELGFLLVCSADFTTAEGFGPDVKLTRTQTIMQSCQPLRLSVQAIERDRLSASRHACDLVWFSLTRSLGAPSGCGLKLSRPASSCKSG